MKTKLLFIGLLFSLLLPVQVFASDLALVCSIDATNVDVGGRVEVTVELNNTSTAFGGPYDAPTTVVEFDYSAGFEFFTWGSASSGVEVADDFDMHTLSITFDPIDENAVVQVKTEFKALTTLGSWPFNGSITVAPEDPDSSNNACEFFVNIIDPMFPGSAGNTDFGGSILDPVSTFSGEFYNQFDADLDLGGPMALTFSRYYGSMLLSDGVPTGVLGDNWRHNFEWSLSNTGTDVTIISDNGASIEFTKDGALWNQTSLASQKYQLAEDGGTGALTLLDVRNQRFYEFSAAGLLTSVSDGRGNQHSLSYDGSDQLTQVTDGVGRTLTYTFSDSRLSSVSDGTRTVSFTHTDNNLTSSTSPLGNTTSYAYDAGGLMTSLTRPEGNTSVSQTYDETGKVTSQTDGEDNTTSVSYDGGETTITDPLAATTTHTHTATGELTQVEDADGGTIAITYNGDGQRSSVTDRLGEITSLTYHAPSSNLASITDADGSLTSYSYTGRNVSDLTLYDRTGVTYADSSSESMIYDASGNMTSRTDQLGNVFSYTYNNAGQRLSSTLPIGGTTNFTYNADATLASITDPLGNSTSFSYDSLKRPSQTTLADGNTRSFTFDNANRPLTFTDENVNTRSLTYDANGNLQSSTTALGETTTFTYDGNDQPVTITDPLGGVLNITYDELGRVATISDAGGNVTTNGYDVLGQLTSVTDPLGNVWSTSYNSEGVVASRTNPLGETMSFTSDEMGRVTQIISPLGYVGEISYDSIGLVSSITDPLGNVTNYSRNGTGFVTGISLDNGAVTTAYTRNEIGQILIAQDPGGNSWNNTYDVGGRLTSQSDPLGNTGTLTYNNRNMISVVSYPGSLGTMTLSYDPANNLTSRTYSDGTTLNYTYDANNRLLTGNGFSNTYDANGRITNSNGIATTYDAQGRIVSTTLAEGKVVNYAYDASDRVVSVTDWLGGVTTFSYDAAGNLTTMNRPNGVDRSNSYDADARLITITDGTELSISLVRDANDQIVSASRTAPLLATANSNTDISNNFDTASQIASHTYDAMGRTTMAGGSSFTWNLASRLTSYSKNGVTTTATYDGLGNRTSRTVGATTRNYVWSYTLSIPSIVVEKQGSADFRYFIRMPGGELLYSISASSDARSFYHFDEMGNTVFVSNDAGAVIGSYAYSPFGVLSASTGGLDNPFTWQGETGAMDEGDGLYYIRARYYDAGSARFISRDPVQYVDPLKINPYQYALNNPLKYIDVTGRTPQGKDTNKDLVKPRDVVIGGRDVAVALSGNNPLSVFVNSYDLGRSIRLGDTDGALQAGAGLTVDAGSIYLTGVAATAEAGTLTGASIAGPAVIIYAGAKLGITAYSAWWDLQAAEQQLEATIFAGELNRKKQARIQAERQARIQDEIRETRERIEQREQDAREDNRRREEAERNKKAEGSETAKLVKKFFN